MQLTLPAGRGLVMDLTAAALGAVFGAIGGAIGASIFKRGSNVIEEGAVE